MIWLDRACIAPGPTTAGGQRDISQALACLPIWLATASKLLFLLGDTTLERMWCASELSMFMLMGADRAGVEVLLLHSPALAPQLRYRAMRARIEEYDVQRATCTMQADTDRLLAVIEAGAGGIAGFNQAVRETLLECLSRPASLRGAGAAPQELVSDSSWRRRVRRSSSQKSKTPSLTLPAPAGGSAFGVMPPCRRPSGEGSFRSAHVAAACEWLQSPRSGSWLTASSASTIRIMPAIEVAPAAPPAAVGARPDERNSAVRNSEVDVQVDDLEAQADFVTVRVLRTSDSGLSAVSSLTTDESLDSDAISSAEVAPGALAA